MEVFGAARSGHLTGGEVCLSSKVAESFFTSVNSRLTYMQRFVSFLHWFGNWWGFSKGLSTDFLIYDYLTLKKGIFDFGPDFYSTKNKGKV